MIQWRTYVQPPRQGTAHKKQENSPCQDKAAVKENDSVIVAVLSDGLGQLEYSQMAAEAITKSVSTYLLKYDYRKFTEERLKEDVLAECKRAAQECSDSSKISISEMDCTLLFVVLFKDKSHFIFGQLGDGAICVVKPNQGSQIMELDDKFKATSNLTQTVLSKDAQKYFNLQKGIVNDYVGVFLTTDGLENELYSKAGKVKKKAEWYFNLISNKDDSVCFGEIEKRWDELTSNEKYGFADDMSLIAIVQQNTTIQLPEDANWLCVCGKRNRLESTRCERCGKDFLKIYKGINFKGIGGGRLAFFTYMNKHPQEERRILTEHSEYPSESFIQEHTTTSKQKAASGNQENHDTNESVLQTTEIDRGGNKHGRKKNSDKLKVLAYVLIAMVIGTIIGRVFEIVTDENSESIMEILSLQKENDTLRSENNSFIERIEILNARILELENAQSQKVNIPDNYNYFVFPNGEVYIGQLSQGIPDGVGVVYSSGMVLVGCFQNRMKNGEFYILYNDGYSEIRQYENDLLVLTIAPNTQSDDTEVLPAVDETAKTYELLYDADVREAADPQSLFIVSLKKGDTVQFYGDTLTDSEGIKWLKITTMTGYNGWVRANQVQEIKNSNISNTGS